ncbi:MAG: DnaA regulatory inactivator Hda [Halofilum sp. (in: g-proteobacteria)]
MVSQADPFGPQMPLGISLAPGATFEAFFVGPNRFAVEVLRGMADGTGEQQALLAAGTGLGKSHLLQATCRRAADAGARCAWLPLDGEAGADAGILEGLEALDLIALDVLDAVVGDDAWERGLFGLINAARGSGTRILFAARAVPAGLALVLPDLASRLTWGPVLQLAPLDDAEKRQALMARARVLGLDLPASVADYLLRHFPRDLAGQLERLDTLDRASLASGRRLTVPFVKRVLAGD